VTSLSGAVIHDIRRVLARRWPLVMVVVSACRVQGDGAAESIVAALGRLARYDALCREAGLAEDAPGCVIVARGGGSLEDLFAFNDERVVRAIAGHPVPVVSGVGHETDVTLADFVADVRAPTPSAAAEVCVPDRADVLAALRARRWRLDEAASRETIGRSRRVASERRALDGLRQRRSSPPRASGPVTCSTGDGRDDRPVRGRPPGGRARRPWPGAARTGRLRNGRGRLASAGAALGALGPEATLARGYAIVRRADDGAIVRDPAESPPGRGSGCAWPAARSRPGGGRARCLTSCSFWGWSRSSWLRASVLVCSLRPRLVAGTIDAPPARMPVGRTLEPGRPARPTHDRREVTRWLRHPTRSTG